MADSEKMSTVVRKDLDGKNGYKTMENGKMKTNGYMKVFSFHSVTFVGMVCLVFGLSTWHFEAR